MLKKSLVLMVLTCGTFSFVYADSAVPSSSSSEKPLPSSYMPVVINETFQSILQRMSAAKDAINKKQQELLQQRYDLSNNPSKAATMSNGKPVQEGVRVKLPKGVSWEQLGAMSPDEIKTKKLFPQGFLPLPHPNHPEGGMLFPKFAIDEINKQENRDLTRFDLDFDSCCREIGIFCSLLKFLSCSP